MENKDETNQNEPIIKQNQENFQTQEISQNEAFQNKEIIKDLEYILTPALEDYIETIALLKKEKNYARVSNIAASMKVKSSSANAAIKFLSDNGLVIHEKYGYVDLTERGQIMAQEVQRKHDVLFNFLSQLLFIDKETALQEACAIEHAISGETVVKLERFYELMKKHLTSTEEAAQNLQNYLNEK